MALGDTFQKIRGTLATLFQLGKNGPQLKNNSGVIEARNATDAAYAIVRGGTPSGGNDLVTKTYADGLVGGGGGTGSAGGTPCFIAAGSTFTIVVNIQVAFSMLIDSEGYIDTEGYLVGVD